jgi:hypothetical protein
MNALREREAYWRTEVNKAAAAVDRWYSDNLRWSWGDTADNVAITAQGFLQKALKNLDRVVDFRSVEQLDATVRPLVEGVYKLIESKAPSWSEPFRETARDVKEGAKEAARTVATYGSLGAGAALVAVGVVWYLSRRV